jgi:predicted HTH transcriptional regulator
MSPNKNTMNNSINLTELSTRESAMVEWKENVARIPDVIETIVAFANDFLNLGGGYVVCGAKEVKDTHGFQAVEYVGLTADRLKRVKEEVINTCTNATRVNPPINPITDEIDISNDPTKKVLVFTINATPYAHSYKNDSKDIPRYFIRTDYNTKEATNGFIRELLRRKGQIEAWDKRINQKATLTDIDELVLRQYLQNMKLWSNNKAITDYLSDREKIEEFIPPLLGRLGIDKPVHPKNFTLMVFGKTPIDFCVGAYSIFTIFEGIDKGKQQAETQWITGTIVEQANKLIELLNIESTVAIDKSAENVNQSKYPKIALKEAVVNAIVHRDYEIDQPTRVEVYADRIEVYSPGGLPFNLDKNKFVQGKAKASWRNQAFGRIFHKLNLAQHQGSGIEKIITAMKEEGCPNPTFEVDDDSVTCILPAHPRHRVMRQISEAESDIVIRDYPAAYKKLLPVLENDIYNYRALELFCEVNNLLESPTHILNLIASKNIDFTQIRSNTLVVISESLSLIKNNPSAENLSRQLLEIALKGKLEEKQLLRVAYTLKKIGDDKAVVSFVEQTMHQYPNLQHNSFLLDQKGRALIDLAKRCEQSYHEQQNFRLKNKAKDDFERYLREAQKVLNLAYEYSENVVDKDYIQKALWYIENEMMPFLTGKKKSNIDARTLFIKHIPSKSVKKDIEAIYSKYGAIEKITMNIKTGYDSQVAYIIFETENGAEAAFLDRYNIRLNGEKIHTNRYIR